MSATGESEEVPVAAEEQQAKLVQEPEKQTEETGKKENKAKEKKPRKPRTLSHPPYFQMIKEALQALKEKSGSSLHAIAKYMEDKHKSVLPENFRKILSVQLKNSVAKGKLIKIKASYKLSQAGKKEKSPKVEAAKKSKAKQTKAKPTGTALIRKARTSKKPSAAGAVPLKKAVKPVKRTRKAAVAKPKQPKSIKSPAAKRAKKGASA
ncbi:hypothetical protein SAY87_028950 [Trapa incisa]|uniref:H15 domain-containing protein n=1 Tax=Trapa incisa TaxID=236973 RepID=A0AAN7L376_9MYRT|nr:hypothetical protein SAY87_028950 [Trapa incisa]